MVRQTNWGLKGSQKGWIRETGESVSEEVDRILAKHETDFIFEEQIRKTNGRSQFEPSSSGSPISSRSGCSNFTRIGPAKLAPKAISAPPRVGRGYSPKPDSKVFKSRTRSDFQRAWKSRTQKALERNESRVAKEQDTRYTKPESDEDFCVVEKRELIWAQNGFNEYEIRYTNRTRKFSETGNISPRTIRQDLS